MTAPQPLVRFDFGLEFEDGAAAPARIKRSFTPDEVEEIRAAAYAEGERSALVQTEQAAAAALAQLAAAAQAALSQLDGLAHQHKVESAQLALACGRKIADAALELFPQAPVVAALQALEREIAGESRLTLKASADSLPRLQAALEEAARSIGFSGRIEARADPHLPVAAFAFDWGDGSASFDPAAISAQVGAALDAALVAQAPPIAGKPADPTSEV